MAFLKEGLTLFGFQLRRKEDAREDASDQPISFATKEADDGAIVVEAGGNFGYYIDLEGTAKTEAELVTRYRNMALQPEIEMAVEDIVNEAIAFDVEGDVISLDLEDINYSQGLKDKIQKEFAYVRSLYDFNREGYEVFKRWYIDGRIYYHLIVDEETHLTEGIREARYIDPRKIRKIREVATKAEKGIPVKHVKNEYYIYNELGFAPKDRGYSQSTSYKGIRIADDSIIHVTSGLADKNNKLVLSYLHKAIKPLNQLRAMEDASVIYRLVRAPERRVFNIDVGNLPKAKAEQHIRDMMTRHKNKLVYDAQTGEVRDDRKFMTMLEDYWLPKRDGRGTDITTLPGGTNLGEMDDVLYFQKKFNLSLNIPITRLEPSTGFALGRASEITRDEVKFSKFVDRLRRRFSALFLQTLKTQLILKKILNEDSWNEIEDRIKVKYEIDNHFAELKFQELLKEKLLVIDAMGQYIGQYFSQQYVKRVILSQSVDEIDQMQEEMDSEGSTDEFDTNKDVEFGAKVQQAGLGDEDSQPPKTAAAPKPKTDEAPKSKTDTKEKVSKDEK